MNNKKYQTFIKSMTLSLIQPVKVEFERSGNIPDSASKVQIKWRMVYPKAEPYTLKNDTLQLAPLFEVKLLNEDDVFYTHKAIFLVIMTIKNKDDFDSAWQDEELQKHFRDMQIRNTLWPTLRQQVLDGLTRLALPPIPLPWLI